MDATDPYLDQSGGEPEPPVKRAPGWPAEFQWLVLAAALRGIVPVPQPALFGSTSGSTNRTPRQRIAQAIRDYEREHGSVPTAEIVRDVVRRTGERLGEGERAMLTQEIERVLAVPIPDDTSYVGRVAHGHAGRVAQGSAGGARAPDLRHDFEVQPPEPVAPARCRRPARRADVGHAGVTVYGT